jgi:hypothetical protein
MPDLIGDVVRALSGYFRGNVEAFDLIARHRLLSAQGIRLGPNGPTLYGGTGVPPSTLGAVGDYYFRYDTPGTSAQTLYVKGTATTWTAIGGGGLPADPSFPSHLHDLSGGPASWVQENNEESASILVNAQSAGDAGNRSDHFFSLSKWTSQIAPGSSAVGRSSAAFTPPVSIFSYWTQPFTPSGAFRIEARTGCTAQTVSSLTDGHGPNIGVSDGADIQTSGVGSYVAIEANRGVLLSQRTAGTYNPVLYSNPFSITVANAQPETSNPFWMYIRLDRDSANHWAAYVSLDRNYWIAAGTVTQTLTPAFLFFGGYNNDGSHYIDFLDVVS